MEGKGGNGRLRGGLELVFLDFGLGRRERRSRTLVLLGVVPHLLLPLHRPLRNTTGEVNINRTEPSPGEWTGEERGVGERGAYRRAEGGGGERVEETLGQRCAGGPAGKSEGDRDRGSSRDHMWRQRAGIRGHRRGGPGKDTAAQAGGGGPPPPHLSISAASSFARDVSLAGPRVRPRARDPYFEAKMQRRKPNIPGYRLHVRAQIEAQ
jgi:hypothetical protein